MKKAAIAKARKRLEAAKAAIESFKTIKTFDEFEDVWGKFLIAANSIYSCLDYGSKGHAKSEPWFGAEKNKRRKDPLLQYLHQARNSDEHGIEPVVTHRNGSLAIGAPGEAVHIEHMTMKGGEITLKLKPVGGVIPSIMVTKPHAALVTVHNSQFGDSFDPPKEHLGKPLPNNSPGMVAQLGLAYLESLIDEAEKYAT